MNRKMFLRKIKRALAGILVVGMVLTGMPVLDAEAANEIPGQTGQVQPEQEISVSEDSVDEPEDGVGESGETKPDGEEADPGEVKPEDGTGESGDKKPGDDDSDSGDDQGREESQPGTDDEETVSGEEEPAEDKDALNAVYLAQVSGNDISGNDLADYEKEEEGIRVVGGYIELPEDRDVSVVDESARIYDYEDEIAPLMSDVLPSQYIPDKGTLPLTRSQSPYGSCWAHSSMALAEIDMMRNGGVSSDVDYSELHLAYFSYNGAVNDPLGGLEGDSNSCTGNTFMDIGGNLILAQYVLANWVGAADETTAPYSQAKNALSSGLSKDIAFTDVAHLQNAFQINLQENPEIAKRMLQKYGGVGTSYYDADAYHNARNASYFCDTKTTANHAVTIVGWDDSFSKDKFNTEPEGDGAWLIRNSWSAGADTDSRSMYTYFWLSYYDKSLAAGYAFDFEDAENYDHNYQYDGSMWTRALSYSGDSIYAANVFTAKAYEKGEQLEAVGVVFDKAQTPYTVSIYKNLTDEKNPESGELVEEATTSGTCGCEGFYTIPLRNSVPLANGETFSVVVRYGAPEKEPGKVYLPYEASISAWYVCVASAQTGQSFYKSGSTWEDFGVKYKGNLRIKAYTIDDDGGTGLPTQIELNDEFKKGIAVGVGDAYQAACTVLPRRALDRTVHWESDRPSIATVDTNGLIKGVSDGTATVTVTCNADASVKATFTVEVYSDLRSILIKGASSVTADNTLTLQTVRSPSSVAAADVQWSSSDERVLTVDAGGKVTGVAPGYAVITAGIGEVTATKEMICEFPAFSYRASVSREGITLTWPGGPGVKEYQIYRAEGERWTNPILVDTITADGSDPYTFLDRTVESEKKYIYKIDAVVTYIKGDSTEEKIKSTTSLYIVPMPKFYSITYHLNGGENNSSNQTFYRAGYSYNYIYSPSRSGYRFTDWYFDEGLTQKLDSRYLPSTMTGDLDLYAGWEPIVYQITYRLNGGTNAADPITTYTIETDTFVLLEPTRAGFRFDGWYTDSAFTKPITEIAKGSTGHLTVFAKWIEEVITSIRIKDDSRDSIIVGETLELQTIRTPSSVSAEDVQWSSSDERVLKVDAGGVVTGVAPGYAVITAGIGKVTDTKEIMCEFPRFTCSSDTSLEGITLTWPGGPGAAKYQIYRIEGEDWIDPELLATIKADGRDTYTYLDKNVEGKKNYIYEVKATVNYIKGTGIEEKTVSSARYNVTMPEIFFITYHLNGGENSNSNRTFYKSGYLYNSIYDPKSRSGYRFTSWYFDEDLTQKLESGYLPSTMTGDLDLYAGWTPIVYRITYQLNGGTNAADQITSYTIETDTFLLREPTRAGYRFGGWYTDSACTKPITEIAKGSFGTRTLYAKWIEVGKKITYELDGGINSPNNPSEYVNNMNFVLESPTKDGYDFQGWYTDSSFKNRIIWISGSTTTGSGMTLYAKWSIHRYRITYMLNGGTNSAENPKTYTIEDAVIILKDAVKEGRVFEGWYSDLSYKQKVTQITPEDKRDITLFAKWQGEEAPLITAIEIKQPKRTTYKTGETLDVSGGEVICVSNNLRESMPMSEDMISGFDSSTPGICRVTVRFGGISAGFETLIVAEPQLNALYGQRLKELTLPVNRYGVYSWADAEMALDRKGIYYVPVSFTPNDEEAFQSLNDLYAQITVASEYLVYSVVFDVQGHGMAPEALDDVKAGSTIDAPEEPLADGYTFAGWCKDKACTKDWSFDADIVQSDITLYAKWLRKSTQTDNQFQMQEIEDIYYYTGKAWKPAVNVYDGDTMLKAGRDYTVKYFNNINANAGGVWKKGSGQGTDFNPDIPYVQITGKGNYTDEVKVNFDIHPAALSDENGKPAEKVVLKYTDQFVTARKALKPFGSIKYGKAMKLNQDYTLSLAAVDVRDDSGNSVPSGTMFDNAVISAGYEGEFMLTVTGIGNYADSISKSVHVTDRLHLMKNAKITLGKNQKNMELVGGSVELTPSTEDSADTFTVKFGKTILTPGQDYEISYLNHSNERVGKATLVIKGVGDYSGTKTAVFTVRGKAFTAGKIIVTGIEDKVYTGRAITQNNVFLVYNAGRPDERKLKYGTDYTISYAKNINKGTATMTFAGLKEAGFSGSFKKSFKISADSIDTVKRAAGWDAIVAEYSKEGAKPVDEIVLTNAAGIRLQNGKDYTLSYRNNKLVADAADEKAPTIIVKGKGNYQGSFSIPFTITGADLRTKIENGEITVKTTAVPYRQNRSGDYAYKPAVKLMEGNKALRLGADYTVTYINNTQADYEAYIDAIGTSGASAMAPQAVISAGSDNTYLISSKLSDKPNEISVPLTIYRNKLTKAKLRVEISESECEYKGTQVTPEVTVYYNEGDVLKLLTKDKNYTVSYGVNVKSGKRAGRVTISGIGTFYGDVTLNFDITRKQIKY